MRTQPNVKRCESPLHAASGKNDPEFPHLSIVIPCLNEAETLATCIGKVQAVLARNRIAGEIVVADNGSDDGSAEIACRLGVRAVVVPAKGYGNALRGGIEAARAEFILLGDADDSHNFEDIPNFLEKLHAGYDLVVGNRYKGEIQAGAMPFLHRYLGNPIFNCLGHFLFRSPVGDLYCGLRAFTRAAYDQMELTSSGMEFAPEMVVRAALLRIHMTEIPTNVAKSGRRRPSHVRTWQDGWRTVSLLLRYSSQRTVER